LDLLAVGRGKRSLQSPSACCCEILAPYAGESVLYDHNLRMDLGKGVKIDPLAIQASKCSDRRALGDKNDWIEERIRPFRVSNVQLTGNYILAQSPHHAHVHVPSPGLFRPAVSDGTTRLSHPPSLECHHGSHLGIDPRTRR